jgi:hypothetical protein
MVSLEAMEKHQNDATKQEAESIVSDVVFKQYGVDAD